MKKCILILILTSAAFTSGATHITGGEMYYTFIGMANGQYQYSVTLKLYQKCNSGRQFPNPTIISIFNKTGNTRVADLNIPITETENISISNPDPCITNPPTVCYDVAYYTFQVNLLPSAAGYVLASHVNFRINGISNLLSGQIGALYTAEIPGNAVFPNAMQNHSANFVGSDLVIVCANNNFSYSFAAIDSDGDQLRYSFCTAYASTNGNGGSATPTAPPPFPAVPYNAPVFGEVSPLGDNVRIDPNSGLITGVAPPEG
ncbi:MAG TPA: hypothetical protein VFX58_11710, partial [Chitinophagaceae bacterium]|nr:hypothetical protein [Chitinophagaceae bacterium]